MTTTKGMVFNIQRYSIDDGPGIRTTVFLKGCPLTCLWCSNPESQERAPQLLHRRSLCKQCYRCVGACPEGAISVGPEGIVIDRDICKACGTCVEACPHDALRISGKEMSVEEVMAVVKRDADFYRDSGGGVTISGGEALMQPEFALELLKACKEAGFHTCLDTSGQGSLEALRKLIPYVDLFYYDIKHIDPDIHYQYTGCTNKQILRNFIEVASSKVPLVVRIPVIPGFNDNLRDIGQIAELVATEAPHASVHLLPYHRYGQQKYAQLGREYPMPDVEPPSQEFLDAACAAVKSRGLHCDVAK
ncbi:MAG: glycyl-radical enzyme activating protein [Thermoleophilia bacterium]|nr:glycyl-radical enzyme activating protein [Thermoleophilia bacterium]